MAQTQAQAKSPATKPIPTPKTPVAYVVNEDFRQIINNATLSFVGGQAIRDLELAKKLLAKGAPLTAIYDLDDVVRCPHCGKLFTAEQVEDEDED